jgi:hypothetical protein
MPPSRFEPVIPPSQRPQTHALDHVATGIGSEAYYFAERKDLPAGNKKKLWANSIRLTFLSHKLLVLKEILLLIIYPC